MKTQSLKHKANCMKIKALKKQKLKVSKIKNQKRKIMVTQKNTRNNEILFEYFA